MASTAKTTKRDRFITSEELYTAIANDPFVFNHRVRIGYLDARRGAIMYTPFNSWKPVAEGGDVPWTRVYRFMYDDAVLWDRDTRVCSLREVHDANKALRKIDYGRVRMCTLNCFNDRSKASPFASRQAATVDFLRQRMEHDDFILLQEMPEAFCAQLATLCAEREWAHATTAGTEDVDDHLAVLTRFAIIDSRVEKLNRSKCFLLVDVFTEDMQILRIANVHLTSALQTDSASKRREQLLAVAKHTPTSLAVIAGDFNEREYVAIRGFQDCLQTIAPDGDAQHAFSSFHPGTNPLAVGMPGPIDKVLVSRRIRPVSLAVVRDVALSDHHPLLAELDVSDIEPAETSGSAATVPTSTSDKTALCVVLPFAFWERIHAIRSHADAMVTGADRWMPHLTIALGFVPEAAFFRVEPAIASVVERFLPIPVHFDRPVVYEHHTTCSVVLEPNGTARAQLQLLRDALAAVVPMEHSGARDGLAYRPHLSLTRCASRAEAEAVVRRIADSLEYSFVCTKLCMVARERTAYMQVVNTVGSTAGIRDTVDAVLARCCSSVRSMGSSLIHERSSTRAEGGVAVSSAARGDASSDIDLQVVLRSSCSVEQLIRALETCGDVLLVKALSNPHGKSLQLHTKIPELTYDVHLKRSDDDVTETGMDVVLARVDRAGKRADFVSCLQAVKSRMKACRVYGQRFGFVPGYGLAIMVCKLLTDSAAGAEVMGDDPTRDDFTEEDWTSRFCARYGADGGLRVCQASKLFADMSARHIVIQNLLPPGDNVMRTATASSVAKFRRALQLRLAPAAFGAAEATLMPYMTSIVVSTDTLRTLDAASSWFAAKFLSIVLKLERIGVDVSHDDGWTRVPSEDYPFAVRFDLRSTTPLTATAAAEDILAPLQADFYAVFEGCAIDIKHSHGRG